MKISVIIAAYNVEEYIEKCLNSVLNQTFNDMEIIVVNDGSVDKTATILNQIYLKDKRIKIISQSNKGLIESRKIGLNYAQGEYILFVDGDDWIELDTLYELYKIASEESSDIVLYNAFYSYDNYKEERETFKSNSQTEPIIDLFLGNMMAGIVFKFIRRKYILDNNIELPLNISYAEDLAFSTSILINRPKISFLNKNLYNYYQRCNSITKTVNNKILEVDKSIDFIQTILMKYDIYNKYKNEFEYMIFNHMLLTKVVQAEQIMSLHKILYKQYKIRNISIYNNKYIQEDIQKRSRLKQIQIYSYNWNFEFGNMISIPVRIKNKLLKIIRLK